MAADVLMLEDVADGFHNVEIYRDGLFAMYETVFGKAVLICVSAAVIGLAQGSNDPGIRRENDEEVHFGWQQGVQVPRPLNFGLDDVFEVLQGHGFEKLILWKDMLAQLSNPGL